MEVEEDEFAPCEEDLYIVDDSLEPISAILKYSRSDLPAQRLAYVKGISAAAPKASHEQAHQLGDLVQELWSQPADEDVQLEAVRQLPGLGRAASMDSPLLDKLQELAMEAFESYAHSGHEEGMEAAAGALEGLLPLLPSMQALAGLQQLIRPLIEGQQQKQRGGGSPTPNSTHQQQQQQQRQRQRQGGSDASAEAWGARLEALGRCAAALLQAPGPGSRATRATDSPTAGAPPTTGFTPGEGPAAGDSLSAGEPPRGGTPDEGPGCSEMTTWQEGGSVGRGTQSTSMCGEGSGDLRCAIGSLVVAALKACAAHADFSVQLAAAGQLPRLVRVVPLHTACRVAVELSTQLASSSTWNVRAAVASALPCLVAALSCSAGDGGAEGGCQPVTRDHHHVPQGTAPGGNAGRSAGPSGVLRREGGWADGGAQTEAGAAALEKRQAGAGAHAQAQPTAQADTQASAQVLTKADAAERHCRGLSSISCDPRQVLSTQLQLADLLIRRLADDSSQWVRSAAQCAAGLLLCAMPAGWPLTGPRGQDERDGAAGAQEGAGDHVTEQAASSGDSAATAPGPASASAPALPLAPLPHPSSTSACIPSPTSTSTAEHLVRLFTDAVLAPRPPTAEVLRQLAGCLGHVCCRTVPHVVTVGTSRLDQVYRKLLGDKDAGVAAAAVSCLPQLAMVLSLSGAGDSPLEETDPTPPDGSTTMSEASIAPLGTGDRSVAAANSMTSELLSELLVSLRDRVSELGPALAAVLVPLARALPAQECRRVLLPLLPLLCSVPNREEGKGFEGEVAGIRLRVCGQWRVRLLVAEQLSELLRCMRAGQGASERGESSEGKGEEVGILHDCLQRLLLDPVWRVRQEAQRQAQLLAS